MWAVAWARPTRHDRLLAKGAFGALCFEEGSFRGAFRPVAKLPDNPVNARRREIDRRAFRTTIVARRLLN